MTDTHLFMLFGVAIVCLGAWLAASAKSGRGKTIVKLFGTEVSVEAAGGILVILIGGLVFSLPFGLNQMYPPDNGSERAVRLAQGEAKDLRKKLEIARRQRAELEKLMSFPGLLSIRFAYPKDTATTELCQSKLLANLQDSPYKLRGTTIIGVSFTVGSSAVLIQCEPWLREVSVSAVVFGNSKDTRIAALNQAHDAATSLLTNAFGKLEEY